MTHANYFRNFAKHKSVFEEKLKRLDEKLENKDAHVPFKGSGRVSQEATRFVVDELEEFSREDIAELIIHLMVSPAKYQDDVAYLEEQVNELEREVSSIQEELDGCEDELERSMDKMSELEEKLKEALWEIEVKKKEK